MRARQRRTDAARMNVSVEHNHVTFALIFLAAAVFVLAVPVATWWLVGDLSTTTDDPDYAVRPPSISSAQERVLGLGSLAMVASATVVLAAGTALGRLDPRWWAVLTPLAVTGVIVGWGYRVVTAGVIGANIGAGLVVMFGGPFVSGLLLIAAVLAVVILRTS